MFCITPFNAMPHLCLLRFHARDQDIEYVHHFSDVGNYPIHVFVLKLNPESVLLHRTRGFNRTNLGTKVAANNAVCIPCMLYALRLKVMDYVQISHS